MKNNTLMIIGSGWEQIPIIKKLIMMDIICIN